MNPSNAKAKGLRQRSYATPEHDALHLWLHNKENYKRMIEIDIAPFKTEWAAGPLQNIVPEVWYDPIILIPPKVTKITEFPIYGTNNRLFGIVDCLFEVEYYFSARQEYKEVIENHNRKYSGLNIPRLSMCETRRVSVLCEIKPKLNSVSSLISQVKIYKDNLSKKYPDLEAVVITTDKDTRFDQFLLEEGIRVFRVDESELYYNQQSTAYQSVN
jgi:hypothetical protein